MYLITVLLLMAVLPIGSIGGEYLYLHGSVPLMWLVGKWFVFWTAGVRLMLAGLRQLFQPQFTAKHIFGIQSDDVLPLVSELGVANFAIGIAGVASLANASFVLPVAIIVAIFYGVAGVRHAAQKTRTRNEDIAMISDLFAFVVFAGYVGFGALG